jgi:glycosyltransferase involved in cell wall biosynthesis
VLRILNVARYPVGGIRTYLRYTYSRLDPRAYQTTILAAEDKEAHLLPAGLSPMTADLEVVPVRHAVWRLASATDRLLRSRAFALVHSQGTTAAISSAVPASWHRVPHVVTLHETFREEQFTGRLGAAKRLLLAKLLGLADAVICVSDDAKTNLFEHLRLSREAQSKVTVIVNGVAVDMLLREAPATRPDFRRNWSVDNGTAILGYFGRFMPEKGFDVLLDAVRILKEGNRELPPFVVAAVNDRAFVREYKQRIVELGLESSFFFPGFQASAAGALQELDAVVMPSRREACPLVAMEAMVLGCPLIASDCIGLREVTRGTPALTSVTGDARSLASAIETFLLNRHAHRDAARVYVPRARARFDSSHTVERLSQLFGRVLDAHGRGRSFAVASAP